MHLLESENTTSSATTTSAELVVRCEDRSTFSFIYAFFGFLMFVLLCIFFYAPKVICHFKSKTKHFSTISAHCAHPASIGHRYLVAVTCITGVCLTGIHSEEFIAIYINNHHVRPSVFFIIDVVAAGMIPLIGIFHTRGYEDLDKDPPRHKQTHLYGAKWFPILASECLHFLGAFMLFIWNPISCTRWFFECLNHTDVHYLLLLIMLASSWFSLLLFLFCQFLLICCLKDSKYGSCVCILSYVAEVLTAIVVIPMTAIFSIHQNSFVKFFGSNYCPQINCDW